MIEIPLSSRQNPGLVALVDDEDAGLATGHTWHPVRGRKTLYAMTKVNVDGVRRTVYMHRLIRPDIPGQIDHANRNGLNNQRVNLRPATRSQHQQNRSKQVNNTSCYKDVHWDKQRRK